jgi:hypothetical protein
MNDVTRRPSYRHFTIEQYEAKNEARFWAKVEKTGTCWLWTGHQTTNGYGTHTRTVYASGRIKADVKHEELRAHRYAWSLVNGPIPDGIEIDHVCHTRLCVRPDHLRLTTRKQNSENRLRSSNNSKSGIRGVNWVSAKGKWRATVGHNGKSFHVGYYRDPSDAEAAVIAKRNELHTHNDRDRLT